MTLWYRAPEIMLNNLQYDSNLDIWTAGTIIYEMLVGTPMFRESSEISMLLKIF